jgi:hypothetical protein
MNSCTNVRTGAHRLAERVVREFERYFVDPHWFTLPLAPASSIPAAPMRDESACGRIENAARTLHTRHVRSAAPAGRILSLRSSLPSCRRQPAHSAAS